MKKHLPALLAAIFTTLVIGMGMFVIGANAALNKNGVPVQDAPGLDLTSSSASAGQVEQLQNLAAQYQAREQQYQAQLEDLQQQLAQASAEIEQYQRLLAFLQRRGLIQIDRDGRIYLPDD